MNHPHDEQVARTSTENMTRWRNSLQHLLPLSHAPSADGHYDIYPSFPMIEGEIQAGFEALARIIAGKQRVIIDGFGGVFWSDLRQRLDRALSNLGIKPHWVDIKGALRSPSEVEALVAPFLGGDDPFFGTSYTGQLNDFFQTEKLKWLQPDRDSELSIIYGCGAALANWDGYLVYVDLPRNEIQYRSRAGSICNLGTRQPDDPKRMYKRFYYVDWVALRSHLQALLPRINLIVDGQRPAEPAFTTGNALRATLTKMSQNYFRARPWFEPGPWGGHWILDHISQLPVDVPNYAWSFEFIAPENGLLLESGGRLLEVSSDFLMFHDHEAILGVHAAQYGHEFPIRFAFLDTFDGGNLSVQCHPHLDYIKQFGETFTQSETYYILDCQPGSRVYLGFREGCDPAAFRAALESSFANGTPVDVDRYVISLPSHKHDLFLIPSGTIHSSGAGNLVLEISQTPYIYTFKMYDWLRLDLGGEPRPLNIDRAFDNLEFDRQGEQVQAELVSRPRIISHGDGWRIVQLPTHPVHIYDINRFEFDNNMTVNTAGSCHVLSLVEGDSVLLETEWGMSHLFGYAETFIVPAAAGSYQLISTEGSPLKVVAAFMKQEAVEAG